MSSQESSTGRSQAQEVALHIYQSSLEGLTYNSKWRIHWLTVPAGKNMPFAEGIVSMSKGQIAKAVTLTKSPHQRQQENWPAGKGISSPQAPKQLHGSSVNTNVQIPKELTSAKKRKLLQKANTKDRCNGWESPTESERGLKKKPLRLDAKSTYWEPKAKWQRTQVQHSPSWPDVSDPGDSLDYHMPNAALSGTEWEPAKAKRGVGFDRKGLTRDRSRSLMRAGEFPFDGPLAGVRGAGASRYDGPPGPQAGSLRFEGPPGQVGGRGPRLLDGPVGQVAGGLRFDGPLGQAGLTFDGYHAARFGQLSVLQRFDGIHGQPSSRFEKAPGQQAQPPFDTAIHLRFNGPHQLASRFHLPPGLQGACLENAANPSASRLEMSPYRQGGPFVRHPGWGYSGPYDRMQFQRPGVFDASPGPDCNGPAGPGAQSLPLRAAGHYFDGSSLQGPQYGNLNNVPMRSHQVPLRSAQPGCYGQGQQYLPNPGSFIQPPAEVNDTSAQPAAEKEEKDEQSEDQGVPDLTNFRVEELRRRYDSVIHQLYTGSQCSSCGMRFTAPQTHADHLDWHYHENRRKKVAHRRVTHRGWFCSETEWIEFEGTADLEESAKSKFFEKAHEELILKRKEALKEKEFLSVAAGAAGAAESCEICQEQFEEYWNEDEEEWHLKNAIRVDGKTYHPPCYEDYQNTSTSDGTPEPTGTETEPNEFNLMSSTQ